jgi:hypothetical protein
MEDDLQKKDGRRPQNRKMSDDLKIKKMEDDLKINKMEDDLKIK